jgi:hypothetical protein
MQPDKQHQSKIAALQMNSELSLKVVRDIPSFFGVLLLNFLFDET